MELHATKAQIKSGYRLGRNLLWQGRMRIQNGLLTGLLIGIDSPPCSSSPWWYHRAISQSPCLQVQLREDDLPQVLRPSPTPCHQLQKEEVRPHQPTPTKEEAKVNGSLIWRLGCLGERDGQWMVSLHGWLYFSQ
ncbi:hypothetical protein BDZ45DRAFT_136726 [Acephala macrosclerotiorum]|nr:hypothetical protein BDZ45DRAFT_136726 [Acephala macrosclerotiorum]